MNIKLNNPETVMMRIITNYFEIIMSLLKYEFAWPEKIIEILGFISVFLSN